MKGASAYTVYYIWIGTLWKQVFENVDLVLLGCYMEHGRLLVGEFLYLEELFLEGSARLEKKLGPLLGVV